MCTPMRSSPGPHALDREGVVDLGGADVVEAECGGLGERQVGGQRRQVVRRKLRTARKEFVQEAPQMEVMGVAEHAAALEQPGRRKPRLLARLLEGFRLGLVAIRRVQQLVLERRDLRRAVAAREALGPGRNALLQALLLFQPRQRELERFRGRRLEAALAPAVEVHRRGMQLDAARRRPPPASARARRTRARDPGSRIRARRCTPRGKRYRARRRIPARRRAAPRPRAARTRAARSPP